MSCNYYVARNKANCKKNSSPEYTIDGLTYCKLHFNLFNKDPNSNSETKPKAKSKATNAEDIKICEYFMEKVKKTCTKKSNSECIKDDKYYCKVHFKIINGCNDKKPPKSNTKPKKNKVEENTTNENGDFTTENREDDISYSNDDEETKPDPNNSNGDEETKEEPENNKAQQNKCEFIKKENNLCGKKSHETYENKYYCTVHYNSTINKIKKDLSDNIKKIQKKRITKSSVKELKLQVRELLRLVHPDKCKIPGFDADEMSKILTNKLSEINDFNIA